jgi:uncharacterized protein
MGGVVVRTGKTKSGTLKVLHFLYLTFMWSWGFWGVLVLTGAKWTGYPALVLYVLGGAGPTVAAFTLLVLRRGVEPPARFWLRMMDIRRIPPRWYLVILGIAVVPNLIARMLPATAGGGNGDDGVAMLIPMLLVAVLAGAAEEPGWRGYALDHLNRLTSALVASLVIGLVWTLWHLPLYVMEGTIQQEAGMWSPVFWMDMTARIPLSLLLTWLVLNCGRSILAAMLLHAVDNLASVLIGPEGEAQLMARLAVLTVIALAVVVRWGTDLRGGNRRAG